MTRVLLLLLILSIEMTGRADSVIEREPTRYSQAQPDTPLTRIAGRIEKGEQLLTARSDREVLEELLGLLQIPVESQVLVYSKTSAQNDRISPETPRAIYFSDNAYMGWVQGGNIEVITFDEKLGAIFHLVHLRSRAAGKAPEIIRERSCLTCHAGSPTMGYPGALVRSVYPTKSGLPLFHAGTFRTDDTSPLDERWGGWYVTGKSGDQQHMGNLLASESKEGEITVEKIVAEPVEKLSEILDCTPYPGGDGSDIVALMVLEHQVAVHNTLVRANLNTRQALHRDRVMKDVFDEPSDGPLSDTTESILDGLAEDVVEALLFKGAFTMEDEGVEGATSFQDAFRQNEKEDSEGRSLKDFRLYERIFKYRCSYLIYSDAFSHLPREIHDRILTHLRAVLEGNESPEEYAYLSESERERILGILSDTLPGWKAEYSAAGRSL